MPSSWRIAAVSRDGSLLALTAAYADHSPDNRVRLATPAGAITVLPSFDAKSGPISFSPSGRQLAVAAFDRPLRVPIWDTARPIVASRVLDAPAGVGATAIAFSRDESVLAVTDLRSCVHVWRTSNPETPISFCDESDMLGELDFDPTGSWLAVGSLSGRIRILELSQDELSEKRTLDAHREATTALRFDSSGRWLTSASDDGELRFWDTTTWQLVGLTRDQDDSFVREIVAAPGDGCMVTLTQGGRRISLWSFDPESMVARAEGLSRRVDARRLVEWEEPRPGVEVDEIDRLFQYNSLSSQVDALGGCRRSRIAALSGALRTRYRCALGCRNASNGSPE